MHSQSQRVTISDLEQQFENYISYCLYTKRLRPKTILSYREVFKTFRKIMPEVVEIHDLHPQMMPEFFKRLSTRKRIVGKNTQVIGVKSSTIRTYYNKLVAFFRWLEFSGFLHDGFSQSMIKPPAPVYDDERALPDQDISKIIATISVHTMDDLFLHTRDLAIVNILLYTGIRKGELLGLRVSDIDFIGKTLFINGATSKSKKGRYIPLHFCLIHHLKSYLNQRKLRGSKCEALIISSKSDTPFTEYGIKYWIEKYAKRSGVKFHLHRFRHTFACRLATKNADIISIMNVMGHTTTRTTENYLRSIKAENSREFISKLSF